MKNEVYELDLSNGYFDNEKDVQCVIKLPCTVTQCGVAENKTCVTEEVSGIPTAFCQCITGYEDLANEEKKINAKNNAELICGNRNECSNTHTCTDSQDCKDNVGSYTCSCKIGWLENSHSDTINSIPCIECGGIGATESNGECTCTAVDNARLETGSNVCQCNAGYEESSGACTKVTNKNVTILVLFNAKLTSMPVLLGAFGKF